MFQIFDDPVTTCLSPSVHDLVCKVGFEVGESCDIRSIVTQSSGVCWKTITDCVVLTDSGAPFLRTPNVGPYYSTENVLICKTPLSDRWCSEDVTTQA